MLSAEGIGKNIEKAIENALLELKASREDVDIKILSEGGLFKKAKVLVTISEDAVEKYEKRQNAKKESIKEFLDEEKASLKDESKCAEEFKKDLEEKKNIEEKEKKKEDKKELKIAKKEEKQEEKEQKEYQEKNVEPMTFLTQFFEKAGKTVDINVKEDGNYITYSVEGEDLGEIIGHRGEGYYALSRIFNIVIGKQDKKVLLDVGGFKEKRAESLTELAQRLASKAIKSGRYVKLEPMNPSDRRIIHSALADDERVTTLSKGVDPHRYVIIFPKDAE